MLSFQNIITQAMWNKDRANYFNHKKKCIYAQAARRLQNKPQQKLKERLGRRGVWVTEVQERWRRKRGGSGLDKARRLRLCVVLGYLGARCTYVNPVNFVSIHSSCIVCVGEVDNGCPVPLISFAFCCVQTGRLLASFSLSSLLNAYWCWRDG